MKKNAMCVGISVLLTVLLIWGIVMTSWAADDKNEKMTAVCEKGVAYMERIGLGFTLKEDTTLKNGDILETKVSSGISFKGNGIKGAMNEKTELEIRDTEAGSFLMKKGEAFAAVSAEKAVAFQFQDKTLKAEDSVFLISVYAGSATIGVLAGEAELDGEKYKVGQAVNFSNDEIFVSELKMEALNEFALKQAIKASEETELVFSVEDMKALLSERQTQVLKARDEAKPQIVNEDFSNSDDEGYAESETDSDVIPETNPNVIPETKPDVIPETNPNVIPETKPDVIPETKPDVIPETKPDVIPETKPDVIPETNPEDVPSQDPQGENPEVTDMGMFCTIEIRCDTILNNMDDLATGKDEFVPANGIILATSTLEFVEGETVFEVLSRACSLAGIQLEYSWTPMYDSYYIEGINNLYEFDCGEQSGWMYKVNGWFPNYGCSSYTLKDGDCIVWCYTCQGLGADVGGSVY